MRQLLLIALPLLLAAPAVHAEDPSVTLYGVADAFVQLLDGSSRMSRVQSGGLVGSRLGLRGREDLGGGLQAFFMLESGLSMDDGTISQGGAFFGRQAQLGLSGGFGSLSFGRQYGSLYAATTDLSIFTNSSAGPSTVLIGGFGGGYEPVRGAAGTAAAPAAGATGNGGPVRVNNAVRYESPSIEGIKATLLYGAGEQSGLTNQARLVDVGLRYTRGGLDVIASFISDRNAAGGVARATDARTSTLAAGYSFDAFRIVAGFIDFKDRRPAPQVRQDGRGGWIGAEYRQGNQLLKLQYIVNDPRDGTDRRTQALGAGWVLDVSRRSALYSSLTRFKNDDRATRFNGALPEGLTAPGDRSVTEFALGVRHFF